MQSFTIHSPLFVFDRVHRRTGAIERTCLFTNQKPENLELEIHYDFPEHSWVQIYGGAAPERPHNGDGILLHPGENQVLLSLNTDNFNFPDHRFKGRIAFQGKGDTSSREWIEINFQEVQDLEPFPGYAAVDLGTSSSTVSLYHIQRDAVTRLPWSPFLHGSEKDVPSAVFIKNFHKFSRRAEGGSLVGQEAFQAYRSATPKDPRCLQIGAKREVGQARVLATDERGVGGFVDPLDVLHPLAKFVRERCQQSSQVQALLRKVIVTYPPTWNYRQLNRFRDLFRRLGFQDHELDFSLDEASAAGLFYIYNWLKDRDSFQKLIQDLLHSEVDIADGQRKGKGYTMNLLSLDFGGGSIDLALLDASLELFPKTARLRLSLRGSDSLDFGGDQVTLAVFRILKRRLAMALCDPSRMYEERMQGPAKPKREEPPAQPWAPPRTLGLRRRPEMFLLPDGAGSSRVSYAGWAGGPEHPDPEREVLLQNWGYLATHIAEPRLEKELEDAVESFFSTRFLPSEKDLFRFQERRCFDWLWHEAEALKKRLFGAVHREHGQEFFPSFDCLKRFRSGISLRGAPPKLVEEIPWALEPVAETILSAGADEVYQAISGALQSTVVRARKLAEGRRVDRIALSGRSSRIPMVRWLLARPKGEGGLGVPPSMIDFDEENAKSAVSKGACLLQVMRETLVGFEVDVADFKANLLSDLFYLQLDGSRRVLFKAGSIDDLSSFEESPEPRSIPKYLSIFAGSDHNLIGQFLFHDEGEALPPASRRPSSAAGPMPPYKELLQFREKDRTRYGKCIAELLRWPDRERIAWMEQGAAPGAPDLPIYRYYLTRNQALYAVRDAGEGAKRLHEIRPADGPRPGLSPEDNPFSGIH